MKKTPKEVATKDGTVTVSLATRIPADIMRILRVHGVNEGLTMLGIVRTALLEYIERRGLKDE